MTEGRAFRNDNVKFALSCCIFKESLHCSGASDSHDDFIRVDVFQSLHGDVVCGSL